MNKSRNLLAITVCFLLIISSVKNPFPGPTSKNWDTLFSIMFCIDVIHKTGFSNCSIKLNLISALETEDKVPVEQSVSVLCNVYSKEYNGRYFHNIDGYFFTNQSNNSPHKMTRGEEDMPF